MIFSREGPFALVQMRAELPRISASSRDQGTPDENKAIVQGSIAYFGTYSVKEGEKTILLKLEGNTFANLLGAIEPMGIITSLNSDKLRFTNPRTQRVWHSKRVGNAPSKLFWLDTTPIDICSGPALHAEGSGAAFLHLSCDDNKMFDLFFLY